MRADGGCYVGPWQVDPMLQVLRDGPLEISLSTTEVEVLLYLAQADGPVDRQALKEQVLGYAQATQSRAVDACLRRLRGKLRKHPSHPDLLKSRRGVGVYLDQVRAQDPSEPPPGDVTPPGRAPLLDSLQQALDGPRLLTLVGPSGVGKSTVARHLCERMGGVWVELAGITRRNELEDTVAAALRGREGTGTPLFLDNVEQLDADAMVRIGGWSREHPVLTTSLRPLRVDGEKVTQVGLLEDAVAEQVLLAQVDNLGGRVEPEAVRALVGKVGGHPLALVLLAPVVGLADKLSDRDLLGLTSDRPGDPDRHRSLEQALDRALGFVTEQARSVLAAAAAFRNSFRLDALAAVAGSEPGQVVQPAMELVRYGLMAVEGDLFHLLPIVRMAAHSDDLVLQQRLLDCLSSMRAAEMREGPAHLRPYRADIGAALARVSGEAWVELLFAFDASGAVPRELVSAFERGVHDAALTDADLAGLRSYIYRVGGVRGAREALAIDALRHSDGSLLALFERAIRFGEVADYDALAEHRPPTPTPTWVYAVAGMVSQGSDTRIDALAAQLRSRCEALGWFAAVDLLDATLAEALYARGDQRGAFELLDALAFAELTARSRATLILAAWELGERTRARQLATRAGDIAGDSPQDVLALGALAAALAHLDDDPTAPRLAEQALATPAAADGYGLGSIARLVLVLNGQRASTGDAELDAAHAGGEPPPPEGVIGRLAHWLLVHEPG